MNNFRFTSRVKKIAIILAITFLTYNIVLFAVCGFVGHGASFWISYAFMMIAFVVIVGSGYALKSRGVQAKDWFLGYPIIKHCIFYMVIELFLSTLFVALDYFDSPWWIALVAQTIVLAVFLILVISCFVAKETIVEVQTKVNDATSFIKLLQVDVEMVAEKVTDTSLKETFLKLAEQVRYSDPMSNENLFELEKQITLQVSNASSCIMLNDNEGALQCCNRATILLTERNKKCKALK